MTKDKIIFGTALFLLIIVLICGVVICGPKTFFNGKTETKTIEKKNNSVDYYNESYIKTFDNFKAINLENIISIEINKEENNSILNAFIEDDATIEKIYNMIGDIYIESETTNRYDNSIKYTFKVDNGNTYVFEFDGSNIIIGDKEYSMNGLYEIENITYDKEIGEIDEK